MELPWIPPELLSCILQMMDTPDDLISIIIVFRLFREAFYSAPAFYLGVVLRRAIEPAATQHALACLHITTKAMDREARLAVLDRYFTRSNDFQFPADMESLTALSRLYNRVEYFIDDYASRAMRTAAGKQWTLNDWDRTLAPAERARFQRAFFQHEMYCCVFPAQREVARRDRELVTPSSYVYYLPFEGLDPVATVVDYLYEVPPDQRPDGGLSFRTGIESQYIHFLSKLHAWELEEMSCVHHYLGTLAKESFTRLESQFVKAATSASAVASTSARDEDLVGFDNLSTTDLRNFARNNTKWILIASPTALVYKGLSFIHQLAVSDDDQRRDMLTRFDWASWVFPSSCLPPGPLVRIGGSQIFSFGSTLFGQSRDQAAASPEAGQNDPSCASAGFRRFVCAGERDRDFQLLQERAFVFWMDRKVLELELSLRRPAERLSHLSYLIANHVYAEERLAGVRVTREQMKRLQEDFGCALSSE